MNRLYRNKFNHAVVVSIVGDAQLRIAEMKRKAVVYERNGQLFVRTEAEFYASFEPTK